ncbi:MAG: bifunctional DNA primase/polymerase [Actinomycetota bacterium]|nr:bifunctional DNA primase/polymerase [Actinomycetota bacterium]MDP9459244.1 bifunctional DNA primase/polymerase [Actinomycetota bacterium]
MIVEYASPARSTDVLDQTLPLPNERGLWPAARWYAALGFRVLPGAVGGKLPHPMLGKIGPIDAAGSSDLDQIDAWWRPAPFANILVPQGPRTGTSAVDLDWKHGGSPRESLADRCRELGVTLPRGPVCRTPNGEHRWYLIPKGVHTLRRVLGYAADVDFQAGGSYVVAAPSHLCPSACRLPSARPGPGDPPPSRHEDPDAGPWVGYFWQRPDTPEPVGLLARLLPPAPLTAERAWWPTGREFLAALAGAELPHGLIADAAVRRDHQRRTGPDGLRTGVVPVAEWMETGIPRQERHQECLWLAACSCTRRGLDADETFTVLRRIADVTPLKDPSWSWEDWRLLDMAERAYAGSVRREDDHYLALGRRVSEGWTR